MEDKQTISVITPTYQDADTLELHIKSFLDQDYERKELILIDDGSTDNSKKIIEKYCKKYPKLIRGIYFEKNQGACNARNTGARMAVGDVYSFLPADSFLKPGLLTAWMEELAENPECAFVYGGYAFVDNEIKKPTWLGGRLAMNYFSQDFDVRELKTANYIDGSFPIRKEAFWGAAEKVGLKDGLWNPQVKSLNDWDFWLSVVVDYGAKGQFYNSIFFETTLPHAGGLSDDSHQNWLARLKQIKAMHGITPSPLCVTAPWAELHGRNVARVLDADFRDYPPFKQHDYKAIYVIGFFCYNFDDARSLFMAPAFLPKVNMLKAKGEWNGNYPLSQAKKMVHFIGSDILTLNKLPMEKLAVVVKFLNSCDAVLAELPQTQKELKNLGINSIVVPFPPRRWFDVTPLPKKKAIAIYLPANNEAFYFRDLFLGRGKEKGLIHRMKDVTFHVFGNNLETKPVGAKNYKIWGWVKDVEPIIKETSALVRFTPHDGLPIAVAEWIGAGRNALTTVEMPFADQFNLYEFQKQHGGKATVQQLMDEAERLIRATLKKPLNTKGAKHYRKWLNVDSYRKTINELATYDEKRYWEKRAPLWNEQTNFEVVDERKLKKILKKLSYKSIIDVGCGNGRFTPYFEGKKYQGCDIAKPLVDLCKQKFPQYHFFTSSVEEIDKKIKEKSDLVFVYTVLQHVVPENIERASAALKKIGKQMILVEPKPFIPYGDYCYNHDYKKLFDVKQKWSLGDKDVYLIDL